MTADDRLVELLQGARSVTWLAYAAKDTDGRPFGESHAPPEAREGVAFELRKCPYAGSRHGRSMNVSALRQVTASWDEMLSDVDDLRAAYLRRVGTDRFTTWDLWRFGNVGAALPAFLMRRAVAPIPSGQLPRRLAALFKAMQGVFMTTQHMLTVAGVPPTEPVDVDRFVAHTEANDVFNVEDQTCSGPPHMVREFMSAILEGRADRDRPAVRLAEIVGDLDTVLDYGTGAIGLILGWTLIELENTIVLDRIAPHLGGPSDAVGALRASPKEALQLRPLVAAMLDIGLGPAAPSEPVPGVLAALVALAPAVDRLGPVVSEVVRYLCFERDVIGRLEASQRAMLAALGREAPPPPVRSADLCRVFPGTVRDRFAAWAGLAVDVTADGVRVGSGSGSVLVTGR